MGDKWARGAWAAHIVANLGLMSEASLTRHLRHPTFEWAISGLVGLGCPHRAHLGLMSEAH